MIESSQPGQTGLGLQQQLLDPRCRLPLAHDLAAAVPAKAASRRLSQLLERAARALLGLGQFQGACAVLRPPGLAWPNCSQHHLQAHWRQGSARTAQADPLLRFRRTAFVDDRATRLPLPSLAQVLVSCCRRASGGLQRWIAAAEGRPPVPVLWCRSSKSCSCCRFPVSTQMQQLLMRPAPLCPRVALPPAACSLPPARRR